MLYLFFQILLQQQLFVLIYSEHVDYKMISEKDLPNYEMRDETKTAIEKALR